MSASHKARILVVEDDLSIRILIDYLLRDRFDVHVVSRVDDALAAAARERFDLFLLDVHLGEDRSGVDLLHRLRRMPAHRATPALACTAFASYADRRRFVAAGFDGYLSKPFTQEGLYEKIAAVLSEIVPAAVIVPAATPSRQSIAA